VTANPAAYNLLLRAEHYSGWRSPDGFRQALGLVKQAIDLDPTYADAHALLAETYQAFAWYGMMQADDAFRKSEAAAIRAVALDSASALGHAMLAANLSFFRYRWEEGEREFRLALALDSLNAQVRNFYSIHLRALRRFDEALRQMRRAQDLDQMYRHYHWASGYILACADRDDSAVVEFRRAVDFDSTYSRARLDLAEALFRLGRFDDGLREGRRTFEIAGDSAKVAVIAAARGGAGYRAARRRLGEIDLARLRGREPRAEAVTAIEYARAFLAKGERDSAITALERALKVRDPRLVYLVCPEFREIRDESRVRAILRGMNLR
jgi:Tfp pilus assembly protein PilF